MCGIAGYQGSGTLEDARRMIARIAYRGPDHQAAVAIGETGLAHARLSIIDLSHGADQPMKDGTGQFTIVFNGEIYNYRDLRSELQRTGAVFRTSSDTEILLHLYRVYGINMLPRLNGMFAFAIHDARTGELFLARDRMGVKPLHYAQAGGTFVFGSELKAVLAHPAVKNELDPVALNQYLTFEYVPTPRTIINGVNKLPPGHRMLVREGRVVRTDAWWAPDLSKRSIGLHDAAHTFDDLMLRATERRLVSDVPLGVFLSGGIDSSAVAWYAQRASPAPIKTFSIGFEEASYDERTHARLVAERIGSDHHTEVLTERQCLDLIPDLYATLDEPFADASLIPTHLLSRFARKHVTVCLGGDGSDELLAGYPTFTADRYRALFAALPKPLHQLLRRLARSLPPSDRNIALDFKVKQFLRGFEAGPQHVNTLWLGSFTPAEKRALLHPDVLAQVGAAHGLEPVDAVLRGSPWAHRGLDEVILVFLRTYLVDDILFKVDRASMYTALEVRAPFMDFTVVEFLNSLPDHLKRRGANGKVLLKHVMRGKLPDAIIDRPKKGFGIPLSAWLRKELRPLMEDLLAAESLRQQGLFRPAEVARLVREHLEGRANHRKLLWTLMVFQLWMRNHTRPAGT